MLVLAALGLAVELAVVEAVEVETIVLPAEFVVVISEAEAELDAEPDAEEVTAVVTVLPAELVVVTSATVLDPDPEELVDGVEVEKK